MRKVWVILICAVLTLCFVGAVADTMVINTEKVEAYEALLKGKTWVAMGTPTNRDNGNTINYPCMNRKVGSLTFPLKMTIVSSDEHVYLVIGGNENSFNIGQWYEMLFSNDRGVMVLAPGPGSETTYAGVYVIKY